MGETHTLRLLFVKECLAWPRSSGHDVHTFHMMRALASLGHSLKENLECRGGQERSRECPEASI